MRRRGPELEETEHQAALREPNEPLRLGQRSGQAASACKRCGACCFSDRPDYIPVYEVDLSRMSAAGRALTVALSSGRFMRSEGGHCVALSHDPQSGQCACTIHEQRPDACRWLVAAHSICLADRRTKGERAVRWIAELAAVGPARP